jgi:hypothetical protein
MIDSDDFSFLFATICVVTVGILVTQFVGCTEKGYAAQRVERCVEQFQKNTTEMTADEIQLILFSCQEAFSQKN